MFKIKSVNITNFMSVDSLNLSFEDNQMTAIIGQNGHGKSTLFYAIAFAICNFRKGESFKNYVKSGTSKATVDVDGTLYDYPVSYHAEVINGKGSGTVDRTVEYKGKIYKNSEFSQFMETYELSNMESLMFMFQGRNSLIEDKPLERANRLKTILNSDFTDISEKEKITLDELKRTSIEQEATINELKSRTFQQLPLLRELPASTIKNMEDRLNEIKDSLSKMENVDENVLDECEKNIVSLQRNINDTNSKLKSDERSISDFEFELKDCDLYLSQTSLEELTSDMNSIESKIEQHEKEYTALKDKVDKINGKLSIAKYSKKELEKQYEISKTGVCHACGQSIEQKHIDSIKSSIEDAIKEISKYEKNIKELNFDSNDVFGKKLKNELKEAENRIKKYKEVSRDKDTLSMKIDSLKSLNKERIHTLTESNARMEQLKEKKSSLSEIVKIIEEKDNLTKETEELTDKINTAKENITRNVERKLNNDKILRDMNERDEKVSDLSNRLNETMKEIDTSKQVISIFEKEFSNYRITVMCESLESLINSIIQKVFPQMKVYLKAERSGVSFFYSTDDSMELIPVSMASGAQKSVLGLAYNVALGKYSNIKCMFLDEIDASCSAENSAIIYDFISHLDIFDQVFFITHRPEAYQIVKDKNDSLITYKVENGIYNEF